MAVRWKLVKKEVGFRALCKTYSVTQHSTTWKPTESLQGKGLQVHIYSSTWNPLFHQSTQYHMAVRWKTCEERGSVQNLLFYHSTQYHIETDGKLVRNEAGLRRGLELSMKPSSLFHQSTQYHMAVRWKTCEERGRGV